MPLDYTTTPSSHIFRTIWTVLPPVHMHPLIMQGVATITAAHMGPLPVMCQSARTHQHSSKATSASSISFKAFWLCDRAPLWSLGLDAADPMLYKLVTALHGCCRMALKFTPAF